MLPRRLDLAAGVLARRRFGETRSSSPAIAGKDKGDAFSRRGCELEFCKCRHVKCEEEWRYEKEGMVPAFTARYAHFAK
jgi:hypothetical protein